MGYNILLVSKDETQGRLIASQIASDSHYNVFQEKNPKTVLYRMKTTTVHALVMNIANFNLAQVALIDQIRAQKFKFKIIVLADKVQPMAYAAVEDLPNVAVLGKSLISLDRDFSGFLKRALKQDKIKKRSTKRHSARQTALVKHVRTGDTFNVVMSNLSQTGAYLEFNKGHLNINDKIQVIVPLDELDKTHALSALVIWFEVSPQGQRSAGIRFIERSFTAR
ncbi:MAG: PilZ domain-containing protein [Oligoflexia bacterium]|nr:PilZ domain-containing protein [Oligoflexia bacterium]